jgi:DNA-directed RNA polymerase specialized sigma24 family protein
VTAEDSRFREDFGILFAREYPRLFRFLDRLTGDPELAADTAQETLSRLLARGSMPDSPPAWLFTVALNLLRSARATRSRRLRLLSGSRSLRALSDPGPPPDQEAGAEQIRARELPGDSRDTGPERSQRRHAPGESEEGFSKRL